MKSYKVRVKLQIINFGKLSYQLTIHNFRNGCATSEDLFWKLDALQSFIRDLHWPDIEFAEHLNQRLKMMACDMIDSCIKRTDASFQNHLKKGTVW